MISAIAYFDGSNGNGNDRPPSCGAILFDEDGRELDQSFYQLLEGHTSNMAEYKGLILALDIAQNSGVKDLKIRSDSRLVVEQVLGNWKAKNQELSRLRDLAREKASHFDSVQIKWVRREENQRADELTRLIHIAQDEFPF